MSRPIPAHGTRARYLRGCKCEPCGNANRTYCKQYKATTYRTGSGIRISSVPVTARIQYWLSLDYTYGQIAAATKSSHHTIISHARGLNPTIHQSVAKRILSARLGPDSIPDALPVDPTGTIRRLQALAACGHTFVAIGAEVDLHPDALSRIANNRHAAVRGSTAKKITALYRQWAVKPGTSSWARTVAASKGWHGPAAWDDIDNPNEQPELDAPGPELSKRQQFLQLAAERRTEIRLLASAGNQPPEIARRVGLSEQTVRRTLAANHPSLYLELTA